MELDNFISNRIQIYFFTPLTHHENYVLQIANSNVIFYNHYLSKNNLKSFLFRIHFNRRFYTLPFRRVWANGFVKDISKNSKKKKIIFHFEHLNWIIKSELIKILSIMPNVVTVLMLREVISNLGLKGEHEKIFSMFHKVYTYSYKESKEYNLTYLPLIYSLDYRFNHIGNSIKYDLFFVGSNKSRLNTLHLFKQLSIDKNYSFRMHINGVLLNEIIFNDDNSTYNESLDYDSIIDLIKSSKCLLELTPSLESGLTIRFMESIYFNKLLITNNPLVKSTSAYGYGNIYYFKNFNEFDFEFLKRDIRLYPDELIQEYSFGSFLNNIIDEV